MSTCVRTPADGPFSPGRRSICLADGSRTPCAPQSGVVRPPSLRHAGDGQDVRRGQSYLPCDGCPRATTRSRVPRLLSILAAFWPIPAAAVAFLLAITTLGYTTWAQALPGVQAILVMSLLQCCWAVMSSQGQTRRLVRLTQLAVALLSVLLLLPKRDIYGTRIWASAFDDEGGVVLPGFAASLGTLFGLMGSDSGADASKVDRAGYGLPEDADFHRALLRLEVSLAAVVVLWLLQVAVASYHTCTAAAAAAAVAAGGANPAYSLALQSALKSHLDLPALEAFEVVPPLCGDSKLRPDPRPGAGLLNKGFDAGANPCATAFGLGPRSPWHPPVYAPDAELQLEQQQQRCGSPVMASAAASCGGQRVLLVGACMAQCVSATVIVGTWDTFAQRLRLEDGAASVSAADPSSQVLASLSSPASLDVVRASWLTLALLAAAMSAPLALPALLRSRHLLHPALLVRPATTRSLGLLLLDANAAKLLLAVSIGVLGGWRAGALTWQLLQVFTVVYGLAKLYAGGLRVQLHADGAAAAAVAAAAAAAEAAPVGLTPAVVVGPGCGDNVRGAKGCLGECASAAACAGVGCGAVSPRLADAVLGRGAVFRAAAVVTPEGVSPAALAAASCGDVGSATTRSTGTSGGCSSTSSNAMRSPYSSGNSLVSAADVEPHQAACQAAPACSGGTPGPSAATMTMAQLARRPPPLTVAGHASQCTSSHHHSFNYHQDHHHHHHLHAPLLPPSASCPPMDIDSCGKPRLMLPLASGRRPGAGACSARGCAASAAVLRPWSLLLASLGLLAGMLWLVLMAPPLAVLGDESVDFFEGLVDTGPGAAAMLTLLVGVAAALTVSGACLLWCIANGQLRQKWRLNPVEGRRLECLAWACGPPLAAAAFSGLSWALGDERNAVAYVATEAMRCASLWPLVWLQEPWLLGGVEAVGGCAQHAGCGPTCCVLRWAGLRPSGSGALGGRCDDRGRVEAGMQLTRSVSSRRARGGLVQVEVN